MDTIEVMKNLTSEQKDVFIKLQTVFESDGWPLVRQWAENQAKGAEQRIINASSWDENRIALGMRAVYLELANMEQGIEGQFRSIAEGNLVDSSNIDDEIEFQS